MIVIVQILMLEVESWCGETGKEYLGSSYIRVMEDSGAGAVIHTVGHCIHFSFNIN